MEAFQAGGGGVCWRQIPSGGNFGFVAFVDYLHAHKPIEYTTGNGKPSKNRAPLIEDGSTAS